MEHHYFIKEELKEAAPFFAARTISSKYIHILLPVLPHYRLATYSYWPARCSQPEDFWSPINIKAVPLKSRGSQQNWIRIRQQHSLFLAAVLSSQNVFKIHRRFSTASCRYFHVSSNARFHSRSREYRHRPQARNGERPGKIKTVFALLLSKQLTGYGFHLKTRNIVSISLLRLFKR